MASGKIIKHHIIDEYAIDATTVPPNSYVNLLNYTSRVSGGYKLCSIFHHGTGNYGSNISIHCAGTMIQAFNFSSNTADAKGIVRILWEK